MNREDTFQIEIMKYIRLQYPKVLAFHVANERRTSPQQGAKLKAKGVLPGVADILIWPNLAIELKIKPNKQTPSQKNFEEAITKYGWDYYVCYDFDEVKKILHLYLRTYK